MTKREIASLAIKLMGVFILLKSISYIPMTLSGLFYQGQSSKFHEFLLMLLFIVIIFGASLAWALFIIARSDKIAAWLIKNGDDKLVEVGAAVNKSDIMVIAFSCIGIFVIVTAIPSLIQYVAFFRPGGDSFANFVQQLFRVVAPAVQIALGIWLFAGAKGIVKLWKKIRS